MEFKNINSKIASLEACDVNSFTNPSCSFIHFTTTLTVHKFRHLSNMSLRFDHPITVISGTNKIGKTSILLLLACSHEKFIKLDSSKPVPTFREHAWKDVLTFTSHETESNDYGYELEWRTGTKLNKGEGKRLASSKAWSGLGKKAHDRTNAKIRDREVRLIDLERLLPARSFSNSLLRKLAKTAAKKLSDEIATSFCYIFEIPYNSSFEIFEVSGHANKRCYLIKNGSDAYSSYNAASGEEALINLLRDVLECPLNSLVLIDEIEAGFHPSIQRKLAKVISQISWERKIQFVITTHSMTVLDSFPVKSRKFIEKSGTSLRVISRISPQAAASKMDAVGHPLVRLYCEDGLAHFLIRNIMDSISKTHKMFSNLFEIVESGAADEVKNDYLRHRLHYDQLVNKIGYAAIIDGDYATKFSELLTEDHNVIFVYPYLAPEKFLVGAYLKFNDSPELQVFLNNDNHHAIFRFMAERGLATDAADARNKCYDYFKKTDDYKRHSEEIENFVMKVATAFSS